MEPQRVYDLLSARAQTAGTIEEVVIGLTWTLCRAGGTGLAMTLGAATRTLPWSGSLRGLPVAQVAGWIKSWDWHEAALGMAAINAVINSQSACLGLAQPLADPATPANLAVFEWFKERLRGKRVAVVGRYPGLERYSATLDLQVLERLPDAAALPDPACEFVLPEAEWVFLSASTLINKTFPRLAELSRQATVVLLGPTVPWLPELKEFGIDYLAGVRIEDPDQVRSVVAEGGGTRLFECGARYCVSAL